MCLKLKISPEVMGVIRRINAATTSQKIPDFVLGGCVWCFIRSMNCVHHKFALDPKSCPLFN